MATYSRKSELYADGVESVSVVHERGRGIAWRIWPGAHVLLDWLESNKADWCLNPCHCVEIGAGVGLVALSVPDWERRELLLPISKKSSQLLRGLEIQTRQSSEIAFM